VGDGHHGAHVVHGRVRETGFLPVTVTEEGEPADGRTAHRGLHAREAVQNRRVGEGLVCEVETGHRDGDAAREDDVRGLRVCEDVELGGRCGVALTDCAAHEGDARDPGRDVRGQTKGQGDVGQGARRHERDLSRIAPDRIDDELGGGTRIQGAHGLREVGTVETAFAVDVGRQDRGPHQGAFCPARDGHVDLPEGEHGPRVPRRLLEGLVTGDGRHPNELELREGGGCEEGEGVVVPRVDIQKDRGRRLCGCQWFHLSCRADGAGG
jgi:hypothetical protein